MARTALNKQAGEWLRRIRGRRSAENFAKALSEALKPAAIASGTLYAYERGDRTVPGAVLLAASQLTGAAIALDETGQKTLDQRFVELEQRFDQRLKDLGRRSGGAKRS